MKKTLLITLITTLILTLAMFSFADTQEEAPEGLLPTSGEFVEKGDQTVFRSDEPAEFFTTRPQENSLLLVETSFRNSISPLNASGWKDYKLISSGIKERDVLLGNYPDFPSRTRYQVSAVYVSNKSNGSINISLGYGPVSVSYGKATTSSGHIYPNLFHNVADCRVKLMGDVRYYTYEIQEYNGAGIKIAAPYIDTFYLSSDTFPGFKRLSSPYNLKY